MPYTVRVPAQAMKPAIGMRNVSNVGAVKQGETVQTDPRARP